MYIEKNSRKPLILFLYIIDEDIAATRDKNKKIYKTRTDGWMIRKNGSNRERDTHAQLGGRAADYYWLYMCCWAGLGWRECTRYISLYMWCTSSLTNYNFNWKCLYTRFFFFYFIEIKFSFLSYSIYLKILSNSLGEGRLNFCVNLLPDHSKCLISFINIWRNMISRWIIT